MCGICGYIDFNKNSDLKTLEQMTHSLAHRGPDDQGTEWLQNEDYTIGFGHRRLSILDLSARGHQPMWSANKRWLISYNGEIYNFKAIKRALTEKGISFLTETDTEVILAAFDYWGLDAIQEFRGMFAFALLDQQEQQLYLVRDRANVKPLYVYQHSGLVLFASELKAFHQHPNFEKKINPNGLAQYFRFGYILSPNAIFEHVQKLKSGHYLSIDLSNQEITETKYWDLYDAYQKPKLEISEPEAKAKTKDLLRESFQYRMVADVPVGVFLSGGYDSSAVAALLQKESKAKLKTFSIGYHEKAFDESDEAQKVAKHLGTEHHEWKISAKDAAPLIEQLPWFFDEPFADSSAVPTMLVSRFARQEVTVALSADGGDELFAGYAQYERYLNIKEKLKSGTGKLGTALAPLLQFAPIASIGKLMHLENASAKKDKVLGLLKGGSILKTLNQNFTDSELKQLLRFDFDSLKSPFDREAELPGHALNTFLAQHHQTFLSEDILCKVDRATMSVSLEGREPLMDHKLAEFVAQLPHHFKLNKKYPKYLLREIVHDYLPKEMMDRPKKGFTVPIVHWLKKEWKDILMYYLDAKRIDKEGLLNSAYVVQQRDLFLDGQAQNINRLWSILMFELWFEKWMA